MKLRPSEKIGRTICAFVNTNDGIILVGVSDFKAIVGTSLKMESQIANIAHSCKPAIYPEIEQLKVEGKSILVIRIKKSDGIHSYKNIAYKRVGSHDKPLSPEEVIEFAKSSGEIQFDSQICEEAGYDDIDEEKVKEFLQERAIRLEVEIPKVSIKDFLIKTIKAVKEVDGKLKPTHAAILFFGKNPQDFIPQSEIKVARFKGTTMIEFIDSKILKGSFYGILGEVEIFFRRNTRLASKIVEFKRVDIPEYPFEAIREALVNAIAHRDYFRTGATVRVLIFDDRIEVDNPGGLLPGLDINHLEGVHETRNHLICDIFHQTRDMEKYGTGIGKMKRWMREHSLGAPAFAQKGDFFQVTFCGPGDRILDLVPSIPEEKTTDLSHLNKRQIRCLEMIYNEDKTLSRKQYAEILHISIRSAQRDLRQLLDEGLLKEEGKARSLRYVKP